MHPIVLEQLAHSRSEELRSRAERRRHRTLVRRAVPARGPGGARLALAHVALHLARALDPDGRVVPTLAAR